MPFRVILENGHVDFSTAQEAVKKFKDKEIIWVEPKEEKKSIFDFLKSKPKQGELGIVDE